MLEDIVLNLIPIVSVICTFIFLTTLVWAKLRRRERDAYYRHELAKAMIQRGAEGDEVARLLRKSNPGLAERREALKLGGFLTLALGVGFMVGFQWIPADEPIWKLGFVPTLLGLAMLLHAFTSGRSDSAD
ncbi:MAG: DUF6249 domain-containing protein [Thermoanaerobaculia bacterium]